MGAVDTALDSDDIEEEIENEVDKVLTEIAGETASQLPEAARKEKSRIPAQRANPSCQEQAIAEGAEDDDELEELTASLDKVIS